MPKPFFAQHEMPSVSLKNEDTDETKKAKIFY